MDWIVSEQINQSIAALTDTDRLLQFPPEFSNTQILVEVAPSNGPFTYPQSWNSLGYVYQLLKIGTAQYAYYQSRLIIPNQLNLIDWKTGSAPYAVAIRFVKWLSPSTLKISEVLSGFPDITSPPTALYTDPLSSSGEISSYRVVILVNGQLQLADSSIPDHALLVAGIVTTAIAPGASSPVLAEGQISNPIWSWVLGVPVWLGEQGRLTQVAPTSGFLLQVAAPQSPTTLFFQIQEPVML